MEFRILGPLEVLDEEETVRLGAPKQRALLGVLLLHPNEAVSSARLCDELWGERQPPTAEKLVQGYVHALRKKLGADVLVTRAPGYELRLESGSLDLLRFETLIGEARTSELEQAVDLRRRALALWRGPPLADVVLEGPERHTLARLSELRLATQIERIEAELELGRAAQLVGELEALAAANPYQERVYAQLMLALYRSGRQADALHAYQTIRRALSDELGLQPGQELRALEAAILRQDDSLTLDADADVTTATGSPPSSSPTEPPSPPAAPPRARRSRLVPVLAILIGVAALVAVILVLGRRDPAPITAPPNSVAVIDSRTNEIVGSVPVGIRPGPIAAGGGFVWVGNLQDRTLSKIDPRTARLRRDGPAEQPHADRARVRLRRSLGGTRAAGPVVACRAAVRPGDEDDRRDRQGALLPERQRRGRRGLGVGRVRRLDARTRRARHGSRIGLHDSPEGSPPAWSSAAAPSGSATPTRRPSSALLPRRSRRAH